MLTLNLTESLFRPITCRVVWLQGVIDGYRIYLVYTGMLSQVCVLMSLFLTLTWSRVSDEDR